MKIELAYDDDAVDYIRLHAMVTLLSWKRGKYTIKSAEIKAFKKNEKYEILEFDVQARSRAGANLLKSDCKHYLLSATPHKERCQPSRIHPHSGTHYIYIYIYIYIYGGT